MAQGGGSTACGPKLNMKLASIRMSDKTQKNSAHTWLSNQTNISDSTQDVISCLGKPKVNSSGISQF